MMQDFWLSLIMVFIAELGDKTQLVSLTLATRYNARVVLAGIAAATLLVHLFSAALGTFAGTLLPQDWIKFIAGLAFIFFGFWTLRGDCLEDDEECRLKRKVHPFFIVFVVFFLAELGDKTMLCTVTLGTSCSFTPVWLGSTVGMVLSDGLAILVGKALGARLPEKAIKIGAAVIFFAFGVWSAVEGGVSLPRYAWVLGALSVPLSYFVMFHRRVSPAA